MPRGAGKDGCVQRIRARNHEAEAATRGDGRKRKMVCPVHLGRETRGTKSAGAESGGEEISSSGKSLGPGGLEVGFDPGFAGSGRLQEFFRIIFGEKIRVLQLRMGG